MKLKHELAFPIPLELPSVTGWKEIHIRESGEPLIPLGLFSEYHTIFTDAIYFGERTDSPYENNLAGSLLTMFVRESVAKQLQEAQQLLPSGMYLIVFDAYRTLEVQQSLFDQYYKELKKQNPGWSEKQLLAETQKYVSIPSEDPTRPSPHNTGGSVDTAIFELPEKIDKKVKEINGKLQLLSSSEWQEAYQLEMEKITLIKDHAKLLEFGTPFDYGGKEAALNFLEQLSKERALTKEEMIAKDNRRLLFNIMTAVGFEPYEDEWWHFNSKKSQMGIKTAGLPFAEYGASKLSPENLEHEKMRTQHRLDTIRLRAGWRESKLPRAAIIKPPEKS
ncbi:hypothetical protein A3E45_05180 [Candidatus Daviesbacteria bacterium RIFCSPHIGHO2_12_FULL_43_11]|uniref:Uncharacterized protein n=1 Tax=Candidatus Daviesbacteria bacterium RIFCSPHIGHO2_12_FULL_43_11 TaxID=1797780 RepID=A0A1F5K4H0_9BACT|nr:MAG: hypothetical protein A2874_03080 [Candidatus Daviesbacteria bacterium RIFCSPHIGHO2_01_FULL_43_17]OGE35601.1 MAG: hypothetical protein A3E45_05180 [Candidatus Daviesbacteria bacterium RIFCSPHIGHO2_12_FULL_43_11]OGE70635.1 MAG: hypothetical protein A3J21_02535 [Candidatus Daviesbacteria bacterium RIFCSPLOWO2_02_FULL_43_11]